MVGDPLTEGSLEVGGRGLETRVSEPGQRPGVALAVDDGLDHGAPARAEDVRGERVELDVGVL